MRPSAFEERIFSGEGFKWFLSFYLRINVNESNSLKHLLAYKLQKLNFRCVITKIMVFYRLSKIGNKLNADRKL